MENQVSGLERATILSQSNIVHPAKRAARRDFLRGLGLGHADMFCVGHDRFLRRLRAKAGKRFRNSAATSRLE